MRADRSTHGAVTERIAARGQRIELRIDEIVVRGVDLHDPPRFAEQVSSHLADLLTASGMPQRSADAGRRTHDVSVIGHGDDPLARGVAEAIWQQLGGTP